ncbi:hypothetical protein TSMEX_007808 [Taenia solium]|eukprot:TsM_000639000 transcript=TsM_000639000 gene=TsM_000639000
MVACSDLHCPFHDHICLMPYFRNDDLSFLRKNTIQGRTTLAHALKQVGREDVLRQSMQNISLVQTDAELSHALLSLESANNAVTAEQVEMEKTKKMTTGKVEAEPHEDVIEPADVDDGVVEMTISPPTESSPEHKVTSSEEEKKAALEALAAQLGEDSFELPDTAGPATADYSGGVGEEEVVAETVKRHEQLESAVPAFLLEEIERQETATAVVVPPPPNEPLGVDVDTVSSTAVVGVEGDTMITTPTDEVAQKLPVREDLIISESIQPPLKRTPEMPYENGKSLWVTPEDAKTSSTSGDLETKVDAEEEAAVVMEPVEAQGDVIIQPVVAPMCGVSEATWGRAQSPPPSPDFDIPLIVPTIVERLGEREDTWGKPQQFVVQKQLFSATEYREALGGRDQRLRWQIMTTKECAQTEACLFV